jgi:hypothetical protein
MNHDEYFKERLDDQIAWYDAKSGHNQRAYKRLKIFEIIAATSIPLLSGALKPGDHSYLWVGALGASIAICSGISALFKFHELWIEYRSVAETLRRHRFLFLTGARPYHEADAFAVLVEAVEGLLAKESASWSGLNKPKAQPSAAKKADPA